MDLCDKESVESVFQAHKCDSRSSSPRLLALILAQVRRSHSLCGPQGCASHLKLCCALAERSRLQVGESVAVPLRYFNNNLLNTLVLLDAMSRHGCKRARSLPPLPSFDAQPRI